MGAFAVRWAAFALGCWLLSPARAAPFDVEQVAPGLYVHHGAHVAIDDPARGDSANIGFVVGERCVAVIDTGGSRATGRALREAVRAATPLPVCYVVTTHAHFDHVLGNSAFVADGVQFVGHANLPAALEASRDYFAEEFAVELDGTARDVVLSTIVVDSTYELDLGDRKLILQAVPEAHTAADLTVYDERTRTLWSGDLVFMERLPVLDGSVRGWLRWIETPPPWPIDRVVPGHGPVAAAWHAATGPEREYLSALLSEARAAVRDGMALEDVTDAARTHPPTGWVLTEPHPRNLSKAFREVEWE